MKTITKTFMIIAVLTVSLVSQASVMSSTNRAELRKMAEKGHKALGYREARRVMYQEIDLKSDSNGYYIKGVYCKEKFRGIVGPNKFPNHQVLNAEHTWPQSKGAKGNAKTDLHHLFPADSKANSERGNYYFTDTGNREGSSIKRCHHSRFGYISETGQKGFEPPMDHKGNVARAMFYFSVKYNKSIPAFEEIIFRTWNLIDPVDTDEMLRNDKIEEVQGNRNPFVDDASNADLISNF